MSSKLPKEFVDQFKDISEDVAAEEIVKCAQKTKIIKQHMKDDDQLNELKEQVKALKGGYTTLINLEKAKIDFFLKKIQEIQDGTVNPNASV